MTTVNEEVTEVLELLRTRRSTRTFVSNLHMPPADLKAIITDGLQAPSSCNHQMWHFVIVESDFGKRRLQKIAGANEHFLDASVLLVACFQKGWNHSKFAVVQSVAAAIYHMSLSAHLRGYGSIWNAGIGRKKQVAKFLEIPSQFEIVGVLCLGINAESKESKPPRRSFAAVTSSEQFKRPMESIYPLKKHASYPYHKISVHNNPYAIHDPRKWTWEQIADFRSFAVYAKSPLSYTYVGRRFGPELDAEVATIPRDCKNILEVMPFGGQRTVRILRHTTLQKIHLAELHERSQSFIIDRLCNESLSHVNVCWHMFSDGRLQADDGEFDCISMFQVLDGVPDPICILKEAHRCLIAKGKLILSFRNLLSWYGVYFYFIQAKKQVTNYGPWRPLSVGRVRAFLRSTGFEIEKIEGLSPSPKYPGLSCDSYKRYICKTIVMTVSKIG